MLPGQVIRFRDYERRSREPDAVDRDPAEPCIIVILPIIKVERYVQPTPKLEKEKSR